MYTFCYLLHFRNGILGIWYDSLNTQLRKWSCPFEKCKLIGSENFRFAIIAWTFFASIFFLNRKYFFPSRLKDILTTVSNKLRCQKSVKYKLSHFFSISQHLIISANAGNKNILFIEKGICLGKSPFSNSVQLIFLQPLVKKSFLFLEYDPRTI